MLFYKNFHFTNRLFPLSVSFLLATNVALGQSPQKEIVKNCYVTHDTVYQGAKGMLVSFQYVFSTADSLQFSSFKSGFKIVTQILQGNDVVSHNYGYNTAIPGDAFSVALSNHYFVVKDSINTIHQFIPYASLKLPPGTQKLRVRSVFSGKDAFGQQYHRVFEPQTVTVAIPATRLFTIAVNRIEVAPFNKQGQAWDYSFFKSDAPDIKVSLLVGGLSVATKMAKDNYVFDARKAFKAGCLISEGDELRLLVVDRDLSVDDLIINWRIVTSDIMPGTVYTISGAADNIISSNIQYYIQ